MNEDRRPAQEQTASASDAAAASDARPARRAPRLDPLAVRRLLRDEGLRARHSMSQNFLADPDVLQSILDLAAPEPGSRVLEVGPGLGVLTGGLLDAGATVTAVELDRRLADRLSVTQEAAIAEGRLELVRGDILDQDIPTLVEPPYEVVANVPYHITSPILHRFLGAPPRPTRLVLMLQREVAERIAAAPGDMSYLSVFVQFHAAVRIVFTVSRESFEPEPEVDSAVVEIRPYAPGVAVEAGEASRDAARDAAAQEAVGRAAPSAGVGRAAPSAQAAAVPRIDPAHEDDLWRLVQAGFRERRKKLHNVLSRQLPVPGDVVTGALAAAGIDGDRRPQTLSVDEWLGLREAIGPLPAQLHPEKRTGAGRGHK